jgi:hypothetical protein
VTGVSPTLIRSARPVRSRGLGLAGGPALGRVSYARFRWFNSPTRNGQSRPVLTTARYANGHSGQAESLVPVGSNPTRATRFDSTRLVATARNVPWSSGDDTSPTQRKWGFDSLRDDSIRFDSWRWSAGVPAARLPGEEVDRVRLPGGPWKTGGDGRLVQRNDAWFAPRRSGFDSPAVHWFVTEGSRIRLAGPLC